MFKKLAIFLSVIVLIVCLTPLTACKNDKSDKSHYEISVTLEDNILSGTQKIDYYNDSETAIKELKFNLHANAYRKDAKFSPVSPAHQAQSYPNGVNYGDMNIKKVYCEKGELEYSIGGVDQNILIVTLFSEVFPDERVEISIDYSIRLAFVVSRTGVNDKTINLANFYPILCARDDNGFYECAYYSTGDPFYSDCADYSVSITANKDYVIASSGKLINTEANASTVTSTFRGENLRSFAFVLSKNFKVLSSNKTGVDVKYYYYNDSEPEKSMEYAEKSIEYFSNAFGEYIYENYSFVQTPFVQGGMEFSALTMISDDLRSESYGEVIVHETAHQWWQTAVGNNEIKYGFLDEGLTEYSVVLFYENHPEYNLTREGLVKIAEDTYKVFCTVQDKVFGSVDTSMTRSLGQFNSEYEYVNIAYIKPCIMYDCLRTTIGENRFFKGLKNYFEKYKYKNATPDDLVGVFEKIGADTNGFFQSFFDGTAII